MDYLHLNKKRFISEANVFNETFYCKKTENVFFKWFTCTRVNQKLSGIAL